jgi:PAS domain S-box-containing protein
MNTSFPSALRVLRVERILLPIAIVAVVVIAGLFYFDWTLLRDARMEVGHLQRVLSANEALLSSLKDLETGQRGYLLTGDRNYLQPYQKAKGELGGLTDSLGREVRFPNQVERVRKLRPLIEARVAEVDATLPARDQPGAEAAAGVVRTDRGEATMDAIRELSAALANEGYARLVANSADLEAQSLQTRFAVLLGCGILVGVLTLSLALIQRSNARREKLMTELDNARRRFQITLSSIGDGVITTDEAGLVTFLNPVAAQLTGWNPQEAEGQPLESVFPIVSEGTGESVENPIRHALRERCITGMANHTNLLRRDGSSVPVDDSAAPIYDSGNILTGAVMVFRDLTPRRTVVQALRRWEHVFQHAGFGMAVVTAGEQPTLEQVNPAFAAMHGYSPQELSGQPYSLVVDPEVWSAKVEPLLSSAQDDHSVTETIHVRRDGSKFSALVDFTAVRSADRTIVYRLEYCSDISLRKRAEDELLRSEERYRVTADSLPQLIWTSKPDGTTEYLNNRWHEETGFTLEQTDYQGWSWFLDPEDRDWCLEKWKQAVDSGETFETEARFRTPKQGGHRWYTCRAVPVRDSNGRILRWFGSCTDIHEQKLAAEVLRTSKEELQLANEALKRSNMDLEQFAYAASHDLQEPLRMVAIYSQLLKDEMGDKLNANANSYLAFASDGALRMQALLKDLLAYSRAASHEEPVQEDVDSQNALNRALENLTALVQETGAEITRASLPHVRIPEVHLVQVFQNVIGNALKYRKPEEKPRIHVDAKPQDGTWVFSIRDNGIGIAHEYQRQIFRIFGRLHGQEVPGTGIGLALCKKLVERSGGTIWVESVQGEGSTFFFAVRA